MLSYDGINPDDYYDGRLGGVVVSGWPLDPTVAGLKPGQDDGFLGRYISAAHLPLGWEVKREGPMS
jgi:hypothetical protein